MNVPSGSNRIFVVISTDSNGYAIQSVISSVTNLKPGKTANLKLILSNLNLGMSTDSTNLFWNEITGASIYYIYAQTNNSIFYTGNELQILCTVYGVMVDGTNLPWHMDAIGENVPFVIFH